MRKELDCFIQLQFKGLDQQLSYHVSPETWERLDTVIDEGVMHRDAFCFFSFDTINGLSVSISLPDIQFIRFAMPGKAVDELPARHAGIRLYFRGRNIPLDGTVDDACDAFNLDLGVNNSLKTDAFHSYLDADGERCSFNLAHLLVMELDYSQVNQGGRDERGEK